MKFFSNVVLSLTSILLAPELVRGYNNGCPGKKRVKLTRFCTYSYDGWTEPDDYRFWLHNGYLNEKPLSLENECNEIDFEPKIVNPWEDLEIGSDDSYFDYFDFLDSNEWYDDTCGTYHIVVGMDLHYNSIEACWAWSGGVNDPNLNIDECPFSAEETLKAGVQDWLHAFFLEISPADDPFPLGDMVDFPEDWTDSADDGCDWYAEEPDRCAFAGHLYPRDGLVANDVCAVCGGGKPVRDDIYIDYDWTDSYGDGCDWYAEQLGRCASDGHLHRNGMVANEACVVCGGGDWLPSNLWRVDFPKNWTDSLGDGCDWYAAASNCAMFGHLYQRNGLVANDVCGVCGGGKIYF